MADSYKTGLGAYGRGQMMIRDHGYNVEFFVYVGWSSSHWGSARWAYTSPNGNSRTIADPLAMTFSYPGNMVWKSVGTIGVGSSGTVSFTVGATGSSEFGGPHTHSVYVGRAVVPQAPTMIGIDQETHDSFRVRFSGNGDGGSPIREWKVAYSNNPGGGQFEVGSNGTSIIGVSVPNFPPGQNVYAWAQGRNDVGWGPWAGPVGGKLLPGVKVKVGGVWRDAIPYVKVSGEWRAAVPYVRVAGVWKTTTF